MSLNYPRTSGLGLRCLFVAVLLSETSVAQGLEDISSSEEVAKETPNGNNAQSVEDTGDDTVADDSSESLPKEQNESATTSVVDPTTLLPFDGRPWSLGVTAGYYAPTNKIWGLDVNPFGAGFGLQFSWMTRSGVWFGAHGQYFLGSTISQLYKPPMSTLEINIDAKTQATTLSGQVGFDLRLDPVVVRYALDIGATLYSWDLGDIPYISLAGFIPMQGSSSSLHVAPGMGILVPLGAAFIGGDFRYRIEMGGQIPKAVGGHLHAGWRL